MAFRLTLTVRDEPPVTLLFDQQEVTIGRAPSNDVVVSDPKVSKVHAVVQAAPSGGHVVRDRDSKNATFVDAERVPPRTASALTPGTTVQVGDSTIAYMPLVPVTESAPHAEADTAPEEAANEAPADAALPDDPARLFDVVARGLEQLAAYLPADAVPEAAGLKQRLDALSDPAGTALRRLAALQEGQMSPSDTEVVPDEAPAELTWGALPAVLRDVLALPEALWKEMDDERPDAGPALLNNPTTEAIRTHLNHASPTSEATLDRLSTALQHVVAHHEAVLYGYRTSVETGGKALLRHISPRESSPDPGKTGVFTRVFGGGDADTGWERLERRWRKLYHSDWRDVEARLFRPTLLDAYREHMEAAVAPRSSAAPTAAAQSEPQAPSENGQAPAG